MVHRVSGQQDRTDHPAGSITEFPIPTASSYAEWHRGGARTGAVVHRDKAGTDRTDHHHRVITEFPIRPRTPPVGIAAGPDGALWFTEQSATRSAGSPRGGRSPSSRPHRVGQPSRWHRGGPGRRLWFTEHETEQDRADHHGGVITETPLPTARASAWDRGGPARRDVVQRRAANQIGLIGTEPPIAKITRAKISSKLGTATFSFKAIGFATGFRCALVTRRRHHKQPKPHFSSCNSPKTYKHLTSGRYAFEVGALSAARDGTPASKSFTIN